MQERKRLMDAMDIPHWVVGGKHIYNQLEAWEEIVRSRREFRWYFYDHVYDRYDWTVEPRQTWEELLHHRCLQLRQKYRKLCLWYSGGSDSHHVLRTFAKHNIPVDELFLLHWKMNPYRDAEYHNWLLPLANEYKKLKNPKAKITTVEVTSKIYGQFYTDQTAESKYFSGTNGYFTPCDFNWHTINTCNITDSGTGVMVALEKPYLCVENGKIYHRFHDKTFELYRGTMGEFEFFYYAPDMPELYIKQVHMLANYIKTNYPNRDQKFFDEFIDNPDGPYYHEFCRGSGRDPAIHKDAAPQNGKNKLQGGHWTFRSIADLAKKDGFTSVKIWEDTMDYWRARMPEAFPGKRDFRDGGTVGIQSNTKYIMDYV